MASDNQYVFPVLNSLQTHNTNVLRSWFDINLGNTTLDNTFAPSEQHAILYFKFQGIWYLSIECPNKQLKTMVDKQLHIYYIVNKQDTTDDDGEIIYAY